MRSLKRRRFARSALSLFAVLGLVMTVFGSFAPAPVAAQTASLLVNNHTCETDLSTLPDLNAIAAACQGSGSGVTITAVLQTVGNPADYTYTSVTDGSGLAGFSDLPLGTYYLSQAGTPGYSNFIAYCKVDDFLGNSVIPFFAPQLQPSIIDVQIANEGDMGYCDFFNYNQGTPQPTTGTVTVNKSTCPEGFDGYSASRNELAANCDDASTIADFTVTDINGATQSGTTPGAAINEVVFSAVPTGAIALTEDELDGYGTPRVFCQNRGVSSPDDPSVEVPVTGFTAEYELKPGYEDAFCQWYNIAYEPNFATIVVNKYACPEGYFSSDPSELAQSCQEPYDPITFKLDGASTGNPGDQETGSVVPNGVRWGGLESDTFYIQEFVPEGYGEPIVFCKLISNDDGSESPLEQVPVEPRDDGVRIVRDVAEFYTLSCDWYNTSGAAYSGIYLKKLGCPEAWEESWGLEDWIQNCTTVVRDASFSVDYPDGTTDRQPVNGIDVWWELLPPGEYRIAEEQPAAWTGSVIYCATGTYDGSLETYGLLDISGNAFVWELGPNEYVDCYWFNLPRPRPTIDPNAPATLTIVKYTCPEAYDPLALEADPEEDCEDLTDGVEFSVIGAQNASLDGETGDDGEGTVTFDDLRAGSYLLREEYPERTEAAFVWSCESDVRIFDYPFTPFARIDSTGTIQVSLVAGETLVCSWYNVPSPDAEGEVDVAISVAQCPAGAVNPSACDEPVGEGVGVSLTLTSGEGEPIDLETDEEGVASGAVPEGEYDIDADEAICLGDSDAFTGAGTLELMAGEPVEIFLGLCG